MEKIVEQNYLYDFYGELLTDHQKRIYEDVVYQDLSISEIAKQEGVSRQGIFDMIKRCDRALQGYEEKLHLVERFLKNQKQIKLIYELSREDNQEDVQDRMKKISVVAEKMLEEMFE